MFWKDSLNLNVETSSKNHIDCIIDKGKEDAWRFTGFYGEPITHKRHESWDLLRHLKSQFLLPWVCAGDYNEIVRGLEKKGGANRSHAQMQLFRDALDACEFVDMGYSGCQFTWKNFFRDGNSIWKRLDRSLANNEWLARFGGSKVVHLNCSNSDHSPLLIIPKPVDSVNPSKPFRFEEMWLTDKGCAQTVKAVWEKRGPPNQSSGIVSKIDDCGVALKKWSCKQFGCVRKDLQKKQKLLAQAELVALNTGINFQARMLRREVNDLLDKEMKMWFQRSWSLWAIHGDRNSKFFHMKATQRYRRNRITRIKNSLGQ